MSSAGVFFWYALSSIGFFISARKRKDRLVDTPKMRHAVPLTAFQERLFDIVCKAYRKEIKVEALPVLVLKEPALEEEAIMKEIRVSECPLKTTPVWIESMIHVFESLIGIIEENFMFLFGFTMFTIIILLQILSTWGISDDDILFKNCINVLKNIVFILTVSFFLYRFVRKIKASWNRLKKWIEEPIEGKEVHHNVER